MKATENEKTGERMHVYELGFLIVPTVAEDQVSGEVSAIQDILKTAGATVIAEEFPKLIPLAYQMEQSFEAKLRKFNEAYFGWIKYETSVGQTANIKKELDKRSNILRSLLIKTVRENTLYSTKLAEAAEKQEADEAAQKELDKSIDALVIS